MLICLLSFSYPILLYPSVQPVAIDLLSTYFAATMKPLRLLVLFAHPRFEDSLTHQALMTAYEGLTSLEIRDLYELYPDFNIDVAAEKAALLESDLIIWQHPLYWYSCPPLLKQWIDMVLEFGWAYGPGGNALEGKYFLQVVSSGGSREVYSTTGRNRFTLNTFLTPFNQTIQLCKAHYLPPFAVQGTHRLSSTERQNATLNLQQALQVLQQAVPLESLQQFELLNDWINSVTTVKP